MRKCWVGLVSSSSEPLALPRFSSNTEGQPAARPLALLRRRCFARPQLPSPHAAAAVHALPNMHRARAPRSSVPLMDTCPCRIPVLAPPSRAMCANPFPSMAGGTGGRERGGKTLSSSLFQVAIKVSRCLMTLGSLSQRSCLEIPSLGTAQFVFRLRHKIGGPSKPFHSSSCRKNLVRSSMSCW